MRVRQAFALAELGSWFQSGVDEVYTCPRSTRLCSLLVDGPRDSRARFHFLNRRDAQKRSVPAAALRIITSFERGPCFQAQAADFDAATGDAALEIGSRWEGVLMQPGREDNFPVLFPITVYWRWRRTPCGVSLLKINRRSLAAVLDYVHRN